MINFLIKITVKNNNKINGTVYCERNKTEL